MKVLISILMAFVMIGMVTCIANGAIPTRPLNPFAPISSFQVIMAGYDSSGATMFQTDSNGRLILSPFSGITVEAVSVGGDTSKVTPGLLKTISGNVFSAESVLALMRSNLSNLTYTGDSTMALMRSNLSNLIFSGDSIIALMRSNLSNLIFSGDSTMALMRSNLSNLIFSGDSLLALINANSSTSINGCNQLDSVSVAATTLDYSAVWSSGQYDQKTIFVSKTAGSTTDSIYITGSRVSSVDSLYFGKNAATETWGYALGQNLRTMIVLPVCYLPYLYTAFKNNHTAKTAVLIWACGKSNHK